VGKVEVWMRRGKSAKEQHQRNIYKQTRGEGHVKKKV
jgi:hypothetical protein